MLGCGLITITPNNTILITIAFAMISSKSTTTEATYVPDHTIEGLRLESKKTVLERLARPRIGLEMDSIDVTFRLCWRLETLLTLGARVRLFSFVLSAE